MIHSFKAFLPFLLAAGLAIPAAAQLKRELPVKGITKESNLKGVVTAEQTNKIVEIVKPAKEQVDKILKEDKSGMYAAYLKDNERLASVKSDKEKRGLSNEMLKKYDAFFKDVWAKANINEKEYVARIKSVFPTPTKENTYVLEVGPYLTVTYIYTVPPAPVPSYPPDKCVDICPIAMGEVTGDSKVISGGGGAYGNCYLKASAWGAAIGMNSLYSNLYSNVKVPGTFPDDARKLRVRTRYDINLEATSFAGIGFGLAECKIKSYQSDEYIYVLSPVVFAASKTRKKTIEEDYLLEKKDAALSKFHGFASTTSYFISASWCLAECTGIRWTMCEEK